MDTFTYFVISSPENSTKDGSSVELNLNNPITFNLEKYHVYARLLEASIWWSIPNITIHNNKLHIIYGVTDYILYFDIGLYSLQNLNTKLSNFLRENALISNGIVFIGDPVTSKISILLNNSNFSINMSNSTIRSVLGFDNVINVGPGVASTYYEAPFIAKLNSLTSILVHTNFISGSYLNDKESSVLAIITPDVSPGSQIIYRPSNPSTVRINHNKIDRAKFYLTDQDNKPINMNNESFILTIEFVIKKK